MSILWRVGQKLIFAPAVLVVDELESPEGNLQFVVLARGLEFRV